MVSVLASMTSVNGEPRTLLTHIAYKLAEAVRHAVSVWKSNFPPEPPPGRLYSAKMSPRACGVRFSGYSSFGMNSLAFETEATNFVSREMHRSTSTKSIISTVECM